jgi:aminomethyltransferase
VTPDAPTPQRTPLYAWHVARGARLVDFAGWEMPIQYTAITEEHQAVRTAVGLFDISHMGRLRFEGPAALELIQKVYTNDAAALKPGQVRYGLVCNERGGIRDDVLVYRLGASWLMVVNASNRTKIIDWLNEHRRGRDVQVTDETFARGMVAIQGPRTVEVITACADAAGKPLFKGAGGLKYYYGETVPWGVDDILISRTGYTGEDGFEVIAPAGRLEALCGVLEQAAARAGVPLRSCGLGARDTLRLEAAMPLYGHELDEAIDPLQAGLAWAVKMDKGDFIGRDALARLRDDKARHRRVGLELGGKRIAREGFAVTRDGHEVGRVTSGTYSPTLARVIAMAYVEPAAAAPGTALAVDVRGKPEPARVVPLPFYRKAK